MDCVLGKRNGIATIITLCIFKVPIILASCTWPDYFVDTQWEDNSKGHVTFTTNEMTGWSFQVKSGPTLDTWRCHSTDWLASDGFLILITADVFDPFGTDFYGYLCLKLIKITDQSYRYYQYNPEQTALYNERVYMSPSSTLMEKDSLCLESLTAFRPSDSEYKVLIRSGEASSAKVQCPYVFLGRYDYTHTDSTGTVSCDTSNDLADVCNDNTQITFNYTTCSTRIAYSVSDTVWCVDSLEDGNSNYVTLYNGNDADLLVDDVTVYRFSCMVISGDGTLASITPNSCKRDQVPSAIPTNVQTNRTDGALLQLAIVETCVSCPVLSAPQSGSLTYITNGAVTTANYECDAQYSLAGDATRTCQSDMTWSSAPPTCTCIRPSPPDNGSVNVTSDGISLIYICDVGFVLDGDANRTCQTGSNSWTGSDPLCVPCDTFSPGIGLSWTLAIEGTTTRAHFMCQTNYTLNGSLESKCLTNGTWNNATPTCAHCDVIASPGSGSATFLTDGSFITVAFQCATGYHLVGQDNVTCGALGVWNGSIPVSLQCDAIASPGSGTATFLTDGSFTTVAFQCATGYHLVGRNSLTCDVLGVWNGSIPVCFCDDPATPQNGSLVANGSTVMYMCDTGFTLTGSSEQICATDGSGWTGTTPSCIACQPLTDPVGGNVSISTDGYVSIATYSCSAGYSLDGGRTSYCQADGLWNTSAPRCVICSTIEVPSSGNVSVTSNGVTSQAVYTCAPSYTLLGENTSTCNSTGTWSAATPTCLCDHVTVPYNGNVIYDSGNTTAYYSCSLGYSLSGSSVRTCETDGSGWSGVERSCETCAVLNIVTGGNYSLSTNTVNTMADFTCDVGYTINGTTRLTCQSDGSWDFTQPTCTRCANLSTPTGGNVTRSTSGTVTQVLFTCEAGSTISGTALLTCDENGDWDFIAPTCVECPNRQAPLSGFINMSTDGKVSVATYTCASGYTLSGQTAVTCLPDGNWNFPEPTCDCDSPAAPLNGDVQVSGDEITFSCNMNFTMSGSATGTCKTDGTGWSIPTPTCVSCDTLSNGSGGNLTLFTDGITTQAAYTCPLGASINGTQTVMCNLDGAWSDFQPKCVTCPTLSQSVDSGNVDLTTNGSMTIATYTCVDGYYVNGASILTCTVDGVWDETEPICSCDPLSAPPGGSVNISDDGMSASFGCDTGYTINGDVKISCASNGSGWTVEEPSCTKCDNLTNPSGVQISFSSNGTQTVAIYNCSIGSTLSGLIQQPSCQSDGTWDYVNLTCVECPSDVLSLTNGNALQISDGHRTVVTYSCSAGYDLEGAINSTCLPTGLYDNNVPVCYCSVPSSPTNGIVTVSADRSVATYSCDSGYILKGVVNRTCQNDSTGWSDSAPTCDSCDSLTAPSGGTYTLTTNGEVTTAHFSCSLGHALNGTVVLSCLDDGTWSQSPPSCAKCLAVTSPNSGNVTLTTDGLNTHAQYTCMDDYYLVGAENLTCNSLGYWRDAQPKCVCSTPHNPENGQVNISVDFMMASFSCYLGYSISGVSTITCGADGTGWSDNSPTCVACPNVTALANGLSQPVTNGTVSTIQYTCNAGSSLNGSSTILCLSDGTWSTSESACVECPLLGEIANGNLTITTNGKVSTANYRCFHGYSLVGQASRSCQTEGYWSGFNSYCICDSPQNISHGQVILGANNTLVTYICDAYYTLSGSQSRSCMQDGTGWNGTEPVCAGCSVLVPPVNGTVNITSNGIQSTAVFRCDIGTSLQGQSISICNVDGQWNNAVPECIVCSPPVDIDNGNFTLSTNGLNTAVTYLCATHYRLSGSGSITCLSDSLWDAAFPTCLCEDPVVPNNGSITSDGITVSYSCDVGYSITGDRLRSCKNDGSGWAGTDPTCTRCQGLNSPQNGSYVISTNSTNSISTFRCDIGTSLNGTDTLLCFPDGSWDATSPFCVTCEPLTQPAHGEYTYTTDGVTTFVDLQCNTGYETTGSTSVTCQNDGTWNIQGTLTCERTTNVTTDKDSLLPALIGVSIVSVFIITVLAILLARFVYLYFRGTNRHVYTPRSSLTESKDSSKGSKISHSDETTSNEQFKIPPVKLTPAAAPISHRHHVLDKGPLSASPAPVEHGNSIFGDGVISWSPSPTFSGQTPRSITSVSTISLSQLKTNMLPPIRTRHNKPSFVIDDADTLSISNSQTPLPKVFGAPKRQLTPNRSLMIPRPSTPVNQPLSIVEPNDTPRENGIRRSQTPVWD